MKSKQALQDLRFNVSMSQDLNYKENNDLCDIIEKDLKRLEQYKKIEEELGIDLITLFKALKDGIYVKDYTDRIHYHYCRGISLGSIIAIDNDCSYSECDFDCYFNDYGENWALTREELENE